MAEMLTGQLPWYGCPTMAIIYSVVFKKERPELPGVFTVLFKDVIAGCFLYGLH